MLILYVDTMIISIDIDFIILNSYQMKIPFQLTFVAFKSTVTQELFQYSRLCNNVSRKRTVDL